MGTLMMNLRCNFLRGAGSYFRAVQQLFIAAILLFPFLPVLGSPFHDAARSGDDGALRRLISSGANPDVVDKAGLTPLARAAEAGQTEALRMLLLAPASVEAPSAVTPLWLAASAGYVHSMRALLLAGASPERVGGKMQPSSPLQVAATKGHIEAVNLLLKFGADPLRNNAAAENAITLARKAGHKEVALLCEKAALLPMEVPVVPATAIQVTPDQDLTRITRDAPDGAVLLLAPGSYERQLQVVNKSLTILGAAEGKSILLGPEDGKTTAVYVQEGTLHLHGVTLAPPGEKQLALYQQGGQVRLTENHFRKLQDHGVYVVGGKLDVSGCRFEQGQNMAIAGIKNSSIRVQDSQFTDFKKSALFLEDKGVLQVLNCSFQDLQENAVYAKSGGRVLVADSQIRDVKGGGVYGQDLLSLIIRNVELERTSRPLTSMDNQRTVILGCTITESPQALGFYGRSAGPMLVTDNRMSDLKLGVQVELSADEAVAVVGNWLKRMGQGGIYILGQNGEHRVVVAENAVLSFPKVGLFFDQTGRVRVRGNTSIGVGETSMGISLQNGAQALMANNTLGSPNAALNFFKTVPGKTILFREWILGPVLSQNLTPIQGLEHRHYLAAQRNPELKQGLELAVDQIRQAVSETGPDEARLLSEGLAALDRAKAEVRNAAATLSRVMVSVEDQVGRVEKTPVKVYAAEDADLETVLVSKKKGASLYLLPGQYWIVPGDHESLAQRVNLKPAERKRIAPKVEDAIWMNLGVGLSTDTRPILVTLRDSEETRALLPWIRHDGSYVDSVPAMRADVTAPQIKEARKALLEVYASTYAAPKHIEDPAEAAEQKRLFQAQRHFGDALMALVGRPEDLTPISSTFTAETPGLTWKRMATLLSLVEARSGSLAEGELQSWLSSELSVQRVSAAVALARLGDLRGLPVLRAYLRKPDPLWLAEDASWLLLRDASGETLETMRAFLGVLEEAASPERPLQFEPRASAALLYLLAYGNAKDLARVGRYPLSPDHAKWLAAAADDPMPLLSLLVGEEHLRTAAPNHMALFLDRGAAEAKSWAGMLDKLIATHEHRVAANAPGLSVPDRKTAYSKSLNTSMLFQSHLWPNRKLVDFYMPFKGNTTPIRPEATPYENIASYHPWFLEPGMLDFVLREFAKGYRFHLYHLDLVPLESIDAQVQGMAKPPAGYQLYRHVRQLSQGWFMNRKHLLPMGQVPFPFITRYREAPGSVVGGGISGILDLETHWRDNGVEVAIRFRNDFYYHRAAFSMKPARDFKQFPYATQGGRSLIHSVQLRRGTEVFPAQNLRAWDGEAHRFFAKLDSESLADLWVDVELRFLDQPPLQFSESLSWGELALQTRLSRQASDEARGRALQAEGDAQAQLDWANAAVEAGRLDQARQAFLRTIALYPDESLLLSSAAALETRGGLAASLAIVEDGIKRFPRSRVMNGELVRFHYRNDQYGAAINEARKLLGRTPGDHQIRFTLACCLLMENQPTEALQHLKQLPPEFSPFYLHVLRYVAAGLSPEHNAKEEVEALWAYEKLESSSAADKALIRVLLGYGQAWRVLEQKELNLEPVQAYSLSGFRMLLQQKPQEAASQFTLATEQWSDRLEYRLSKQMLQQLQQVKEETP